MILTRRPFTFYCSNWTYCHAALCFCWFGWRCTLRGRVETDRFHTRGAVTLHFNTLAPDIIRTFGQPLNLLPPKRGLRYTFKRNWQAIYFKETEWGGAESKWTAAKCETRQSLRGLRRSQKPISWQSGLLLEALDFTSEEDQTHARSFVCVKCNKWSFCLESVDPAVSFCSTLGRGCSSRRFCCLWAAANQQKAGLEREELKQLGSDRGGSEG